MNEKDPSQLTPTDTPKEQPDLGQTTPPRGNGDLDADAVEQGEEKLDQIVGN